MSTDKICAKNDKLPASCRYTGVSKESDCEVKCNAYQWCIAYSYKAAENTCILVTSTGSCNAGQEVRGTDNIAASTNQLKESETVCGGACRGLNCMLKPEAGTKWLLNVNLLLRGY